MDDIRQQVEENSRLLEKNYKLLKKIHKHIVISRIFRIIYWVLIIGAAIGLFYFLQPYVESVYSTYQDLIGRSEAQQEDLDLDQFQDILQNI